MKIYIFFVVLPSITISQHSDVSYRKYVLNIEIEIEISGQTDMAVTSLSLGRLDNFTFTLIGLWTAEH